MTEPPHEASAVSTLITPFSISALGTKTDIEFTCSGKTLYVSKEFTDTTPIGTTIIVKDASKNKYIHYVCLGKSNDHIIFSPNGEQHYTFTFNNQTRKSELLLPFDIELDEHCGLFYRGYVESLSGIDSGAATQVIPSCELYSMIKYIFSKLSA